MKLCLPPSIRPTLSEQGLNLVVMVLMAITFATMMHYEINRGGAGLHLPANIVIWAMMALLTITLYLPHTKAIQLVNPPGRLWLLFGALMISLPGLFPASLQHIAA